MRLGLVVVVMLLGGAQCQWTAQFPSDEVVRQINMNYRKYETLGCVGWMTAMCSPVIGTVLLIRLPQVFLMLSFMVFVKNCI